MAQAADINSTVPKPLCKRRADFSLLQRGADIELRIKVNSQSQYRQGHAASTNVPSRRMLNNSTLYA